MFKILLIFFKFKNSHAFLRFDYAMAAYTGAPPPKPFDSRYASKSTLNTNFYHYTIYTQKIKTRKYIYNIKLLNTRNTKYEIHEIYKNNSNCNVNFFNSISIKAVV